MCPPYLQHYRKDVEGVEKGTRILPGFEGISYRGRLDNLGLFALECQRLGEEDMIETSNYKKHR